MDAKEGDVAESEKRFHQERKAARLAGVWMTYGGDAESLQLVVAEAKRPNRGAQLPLEHPVLAQIVSVANVGRPSKAPWSGASLTVWAMAVRKIQLQEMVNA